MGEKYAINQVKNQVIKQHSKGIKCSYPQFQKMNKMKRGVTIMQINVNEMRKSKIQTKKELITI